MNTETLARNDPLAGLTDDWDSASKYLAMFIGEAQDTLNEMTEALLSLEARGGQKEVERLFVAAHRLKGSAASIGLGRAAKLAHLAEDLLQGLTSGGRPLTPAVGDALLGFADGLRTYIEALKEGRFGDDRFDAVAQELLAVYSGSEKKNDECGMMNEGSGFRIQGSGPPNPQSQIPNQQIPHPSSLIPHHSDLRSPVGDDLHRRVAAAVCEDQRGMALVGRIVFQPGLPLAGLKARLLYEKLSNLGKVCYFDPPADQLETLDDLAAAAFGVVTEKSVETVRRWVRVAGVQSMALEPLAAGQPFAEASRTGEVFAKTAGENGNPTAKTSAVRLPSDAGAFSGPKPAETLRVDVGRLDQLMNLAGQLAVGKSRVARIAAGLKTVVEGNRPANVLLHDLFETLHLLDRVADGIQQGAMRLRMVPIGPLLARFHRVVRDITRHNGKHIRLVIRGENTDLDKRMIDELGDPLIHAVRNAADHGIETQEERLAAGKLPQGTITLEARHHGGNVVIRISDDGRGIDTARLRQKALEKGLLTAADAAGMSRQQLLQLAWLPGLSTAEQVSELSGRGLGMDIVRSKIEELNGTVELESEPGRGTAVVVKLPLTLAILRCLMVEIDGAALAVPLESVAEIIRPAGRDVTTVQGHPTVVVRGRVVPVVTLDAVFSGRPDAWREDDRQLPGLTLVVLGQEEGQLGLRVDRLLGEEEVVVKPLGANYRDVPGVAGASVVADGRVALILDPHTLTEIAATAESQKISVVSGTRSVTAVAGRIRRSTPPATAVAGRLGDIAL